MTKQTPSTTARDLFWYLLMIAMLYTSVISFIAIVWQSINIGFPDALSYSYTNSSQIILTSMATLVVAWPVFIGVSWLINRDLRAHPGKQELWVRRWLVSFTLFVAAITVIVDLISVTMSFFSGELTMRFFLKVLTVLLVAAAVFGYYLWDLRREAKGQVRMLRGAAVVASLLVIGWITVGFTLTGSPWYQRSLRFDNERVSDMQSIQWQVIEYWQAKEALPEDLEALEASLIGYQQPVDPETGEPYAYRIVEGMTFELCATFDEASVGGELDKYPVSNARGVVEDMSWEHEAGYTCFERTIDPDVYKPTP